MPKFIRTIIILIVCSILIIYTTLTTEPILGMNSTSYKLLGMLLIMILFWISEIIPLGVTSLIPIVYAPLIGLDTLANVTANYGNPIIFLFLGGFVLGISMEKWGLHKRVSLLLLSKFGTQPKKQLMGFMCVSALFSMWISNTATVIILLPIVLAIINSQLDENNSGLGKALLIGVAYAASIGGIATLIGTPPNTLLRGFLETNYQIQLSFVKWMLFATPLAMVILLFAYFMLVQLFKLNNMAPLNKSYDFKGELKKLGKISNGELIVSIVFLSTAFCWIFKDIINAFLNIKLTDEIISIIGMISLFIIPTSIHKKQFTMDLESLRHVPYDILLLFGGGLALSSLFIKTGLSGWFASNVAVIATFGLLTIILITVFVTNLLTEFISNSPVTATFLPIFAALAIGSNINPLLLTIPLTLAASCAFMFPVGTPPNAIIFGSGKLKIADLIKSGIILSIVSTILIALASYFLIPLILI